jgi:hypothetical protein
MGLIPDGPCLSFRTFFCAGSAALVFSPDGLPVAFTTVVLLELCLLAALCPGWGVPWCSVLCVVVLCGSPGLCCVLFWGAVVLCAVCCAVWVSWSVLCAVLECCCDVMLVLEVWVCCCMCRCRGCCVLLVLSCARRVALGVCWLCLGAAFWL